MNFNPSSSSIDILQKKKQRLQTNGKAYCSTKLKIMDSNFKPQIKRKFSQHDLKHVFWTGVNKQIKNSNLMPFTINNKKKEKISKNQNNFYLDTTSKIKLQNQIQNQSVQQKINFDTLKGFQMTFNKIFLPSITKNGKSQENLQRLLQNDLIQNKQTNKFRKTISSDQRSAFHKGQQNVSTINRFKSRSVVNLKNKLRLQKIKISKKVSNHFQKQQNQNVRSSRNQNQLSPQQLSNQSPRNNQKKFHINNLNLNAPQGHHQGVTKRSYVLKLLQNHDKVLARSQNRKNSLANLMERQNMSLKKSAMNFHQDDNFIARSITFSHPDQLLLKKIMGKLRRQENENEKKMIKKQWQQNNISEQTIKQKFKKQIINGWDIKKQDQPNIFGMQNGQFEEI